MKIGCFFGKHKADVAHFSGVMPLTYGFLYAGKHCYCKHCRTKFDCEDERLPMLMPNYEPIPMRGRSVIL